MPETRRRAMEQHPVVPTTFAALSTIFSGHCETIASSGCHGPGAGGCIPAEGLNGLILLRRREPGVYTVHLTEEAEPSLVFLSRRRRRR